MIDIDDSDNYIVIQEYVGDRISGESDVIYVTGHKTLEEAKGDVHIKSGIIAKIIKERKQDDIQEKIRQIIY